MQVGSTYKEEIIITEKDVNKFADFSGDYNTVHFDEQEAVRQGFKGRIVHGMATASFFSRIFASKFPGPGAVYLNQTLKFHSPVYIGETLHYKLEVTSQKEGKPIFTIKTEVLGDDLSVKVSGEAVIRYQKQV